MVVYFVSQWIKMFLSQVICATRVCFLVSTTIPALLQYGSLCKMLLLNFQLPKVGFAGCCELSTWDTVIIVDHKAMHSTIKPLHGHSPCSWKKLLPNIKPFRKIRAHWDSCAKWIQSCRSHFPHLSMLARQGIIITTVPTQCLTNETLFSCLWRSFNTDVVLLCPGRCL